MVLHDEMQKIVNDIFYEVIQRIGDQIRQGRRDKGQRPLRWPEHDCKVRSKIAGGILKSIAFAQDTDGSQP
jgi:hypothetical protein